MPHRTCVAPPSLHAHKPRLVLPPPPQGYSYPSDIWSIGVTILEVAAGKYPFKARGPFDLFEEICSDKPPVDCLPPGKFSEDFIDFVTCMLRRVSAGVDGWTDLVEQWFQSPAFAACFFLSTRTFPYPPPDSLPEPSGAADRHATHGPSLHYETCRVWLW